MHGVVRERPDAIELAGLRFQVSVAEEALEARPQDCDLLRFLAHAYTLLDRCGDGLAAELRIVEQLPADPRARYNLACSLALNGRKEEALSALEEAIRLGFEDAELLSQDDDLGSLRNDPAFVAMVDALRRRPRAP